MTIISIVHELRMASGTNMKKKILKKYENDGAWREILKATYDTRIVYNVGPPSSLEFEESPIEFDLFDSLEKLSEREVSGNAAKQLASEMSEKYGEIYRLILGRSIKAGVSSTTINKVYPGLIPVFKSMKGLDTPILEFPVRSSIKFDGVKVFAFVRSSEITLTSSSGAEFILESLIEELNTATYGVYEGELVHKDGRQIYRTKISGQLNSLLAGTKTDLEDYTYQIYDFVPLEEWDVKYGVSTFFERQSMLIAQFETGFQDSKYIKQVEHIQHESIKEVEKYFEYLISEKYEGSMHRYDEDVYEWKRVPRLIKKKTIKECVLTCTEVVPHSNPAKGLTGSLVCEGKIKDKDVGEVFIQVNVGSGLSKFDIQRTPDYFINESIEILYNTVLETGGKFSLFLPRFKRVVGNV
jgi:DNA ligase 1